MSRAALARIAWWLLGTATGVHAADPGTSTEAAYVAQVQRWQAERVERLRAPGGWLCLAGLYPLSPGTWSLGSAPGSDLVFPPSAPPHLGRLEVTAAAVVAVPDPGVALRTADGTQVPAAGLRLTTDADSAGATRLSAGSLTWWVIERAGARYLRLTDADSPVRAGFEGLDYYPVDPAWRVTARRELPAAARTVDVPTVLGTPAPSASAGWFVFDLDGRTHRLEALADPGDEEFFVIFADATNGAGTYGAGRFLWVEAPADGQTYVLDFNRAYNPPCAFTPWATCPLPPPGNRLDVPVAAGEKAWHDH